MILDYSTFTEVDPNSHLVLVGTDHLDFDAYRDEDCYLYKDYGVDYFDDFVHKVDMKFTTNNLGQIGFSWVLANDIDDWYGLHTNSKTAIGVHFEYSPPHIIRLRETHGGSMYGDNYTCSVDTWYYLTITKSGTALTCKIYSDSARTTLLDTLSLTLHADHKFRYLFGANTYNSGLVGALYLGTFDIENLSILTSYTTVALVRKRVKAISASLIDADIEENIYEAEGIIDATMRLSARGSSPDFTFDAVKHSIIRQTCTDLAAFLTIFYDPGGSFLTLADAEMTANMLWNSSEDSLSLLSDPRVVTYLKEL